MTSIANSTFPPIPADVGAKTGPRILGYLFHWGLFGILCVQVYLYHLAFPKDPLRNKVLVYFVFILEVVQTIIITESAFHVFGNGYGNFADFNNVDVAWFSVPIISGVVAFIAQGFYAYRISVLAQSYWVAGAIVFLAFVQLGGAIAAAVVMKHAVFFSHLLGLDYSIAGGIWNGGSAVCDVIIAVAMTYYLSARGSGTTQHTNILLRRVIRLVIETGTVTAVIAALNVILANLPGQPSYYLATSEILAKVYSNSMMVVLNSRMRIGADYSPSADGHTQVSTVGRVRRDINTMSRGGTDAYELGEGVLITREELVYRSEESKDPNKDKAAYLV